MSETIGNVKVVEPVLPVKTDGRKVPRTEAQLAVLAKARLKAHTTIQARVKANPKKVLKEPEPIVVSEPEPVPEPVIEPKVEIPEPKEEVPVVPKVELKPEVKPEPKPKPVPEPKPVPQPKPEPEPEEEETLYFSRETKKTVNGVPKKTKYRFVDGYWFKN